MIWTDGLSDQPEMVGAGMVGMDYFSDRPECNVSEFVLCRSHRP